MKEIKFLQDVSRSELNFKKGGRYTVKVLQYQTAGSTYSTFVPYSSITTIAPNGANGWVLYPIAIVEFENGKVMSFALDSEIHIVGDAE
jgi:hypothetical protein